jgi:hypothetical protein
VVELEVTGYLRSDARPARLARGIILHAAPGFASVIISRQYY